MKLSTKSWLELADRDLKAAQKLLEDEYLTNIVLFHCQQCIEKCFKALLEEADITPPKIHGIHRLNALVQEKTPFHLPISDEEIDLIDDIYIDTRYPGSFGLLPTGFPTKEQAEEILKIAERVYRETRKILTELGESYGSN